MSETAAEPAPAAPKVIADSGRRLRVALIWNETIQWEELYEDPDEITLGPEGDFPLPEGVVEGDRIVLIERSDRVGYTLRLAPELSGAVWIGGDRHALSNLGVPGTAVPLGPDDYGVVTIGSVAVFFQFVKPAPSVPRNLTRIDPAMLASFSLVVFLTLVSVIIIADLSARTPAPRYVGIRPIDEARIMDFIVEQPTPPPSRSGEQQQEEDGTRGREEGGRRADGQEGRVGRRDAPTQDTQIQGEQSGPPSGRVADAPLIAALTAEGGNPIASALDVPTVGDLLGGTGAGMTRIGRGAGGSGLRGSGMGGGGMGPGSLFGAGSIGTGMGSGPGGMGSGGTGMVGTGMGRGEVQISVRPGRPRLSNGYLSASQIQRVINRRRSALRACYSTALQRQPNLRGRVSVAFRITMSGGVSGARVAGSSLGNGRVEGCVVRVVRSMRFPQPDGGEVRVTYPFIFGAN